MIATCFELENSVVCECEIGKMVVDSVSKVVVSSVTVVFLGYDTHGHTVCLLIITWKRSRDLAAGRNQHWDHTS